MAVRLTNSMLSGSAKNKKAITEDQAKDFIRRDFVDKKPGRFSSLKQRLFGSRRASTVGPQKKSSLTPPKTNTSAWDIPYPFADCRPGYDSEDDSEDRNSVFDPTSDSDTQKMPEAESMFTTGRLTARQSLSEGSAHQRKKAMRKWDISYPFAEIRLDRLVRSDSDDRLSFELPTVAAKNDQELEVALDMAQQDSSIESVTDEKVERPCFRKMMQAEFQSTQGSSSAESRGLKCLTSALRIPERGTHDSTGSFKNHGKFMGRSSLDSAYCSTPARHPNCSSLSAAGSSSFEPKKPKNTRGGVDGAELTGLLPHFVPNDR